MVYRLAHLSDLHATRVRIPPRPLRSFANKRALGWISWWLRRRHEYRPEILRALIRDLRALAPDHVAVTGDLTHLGLESEVAEAVEWLDQIGDADSVSLVPGNHDAYVGALEALDWTPWAAFLRSDRSFDGSATGGSNGVDFPSVRIRGPLALVGLSSARPSPIGQATGRVGKRQLERLAPILEGLGRTNLFRVVLIHHPPTGVEGASRRQLTDAQALRRVIERHGADLVLHGHTHRDSVDRVPGPAGPIPVVGVRSSSAAGRRPGRRARYHVYSIEGSDREHRHIQVEIRGFDADSGLFVRESRRPLDV